MADLTKLTAAVADNTALTGQVVIALQTANDQTGVDTLTSQVISNNTNIRAALAPAVPAA